MDSASISLSQTVQRTLDRLPPDVQSFARSQCDFKATESSGIGSTYAYGHKRYTLQFNRDANEADVATAIASKWLEHTHGYSTWSGWDKDRKESMVRSLARTWRFAILPTETDAMIERLRKTKTPKDDQEVIESALTFARDDSTPGNELDLQRIYNESCISIDKFIDSLKEWPCGVGWLPEQPTSNKDPIAGLHEHRRWYSRVDRAIRNDLPRSFDPERIDLCIKLLQELRDLLLKYPSYDQEIWKEAKERAGVPEKLSSAGRTDNRFRLSEETQPGTLSLEGSPLHKLVEQAHQVELRAALEERFAYTPEVDGCYRELDSRYAGAVQELANAVERLWKERIAPVWHKGEPIDLYNGLTGGTISGPMEMLCYAAGEIADGRMANPRHRELALRNCETLIGLFTGFMEILAATGGKADTQNPPVPEAKRKSELILSWLRGWLWRLYETTIKATLEMILNKWGG
jgi:hypothetical protein